MKSQSWSGNTPSSIGCICGWLTNTSCRERGRAIDRKLEIVSRTVETLLSLEQTRSSLRVEWYIVALIVAELAIAAYSLMPGH